MRRLKQPWELSPYDHKRYMKHQREFQLFKRKSQNYTRPTWTARAALALYRMADMLGLCEHQPDGRVLIRGIGNENAVPTHDGRKQRQTRPQ